MNINIFCKLNRFGALFSIFSHSFIKDGRRKFDRWFSYVTSSDRRSVKRWTWVMLEYRIFNRLTLDFCSYYSVLFRIYRKNRCYSPHWLSDVVKPRCMTQEVWAQEVVPSKMYDYADSLFKFLRSLSYYRQYHDAMEPIPKLPRCCWSKVLVFSFVFLES